LLPLAFALLAVGEKFPPWLDLALRLDQQIQERGGTTASVTTKATRVVCKSKNQVIAEYEM